jgi:hypothetical protein
MNRRRPLLSGFSPNVRKSSTLTGPMRYRSFLDCPVYKSLCGDLGHERVILTARGTWLLAPVEDESPYMGGENG